MRLNPHLAINPPVCEFGKRNAILTGRSRSYHVADFSGPLSIKATLEGTSMWTVRQRDCRISESSYLVVNRGEPYTMFYEGPYEVTTFCVLFREGLLPQLHGAMRQSGLSALDDPCRSQTLEFPLQIHAGPSTVLQALTEFATELGSAHMPEELWALRFDQLAVTLLIESGTARPRLDRLSSLKLSTRKEMAKRAMIGRDFLLSMSDQQITVEDAARAACLSTFHFHRAFKELFGVPPHAFVRRHRMNRAAHLLRYTDLPAQEVVRRVGLKSVGSFTASFRRTFGVPLHSYRMLRDRN